eukprot:CAMPEP_0206145102 /NCGR_PEP_ID=MMETSP1473-20131121/26353_1 /ASSEMBLY_ACC=CAM_ASM_001109 /TAXON_ID=1461547 /ORGANISM="Stichococcus sp, Strain RCC1054" /LENGTH=73 /DNA_ID=CAMNT_0053541177 /DNA_START=143 /DNA_END=360 /DNA_ORIENTATION=+
MTRGAFTEDGIRPFCQTPAVSALWFKEARLLNGAKKQGYYPGDEQTRPSDNPPHKELCRVVRPSRRDSSGHLG